MGDHVELTFRRFDAEQAQGIRDVVERIYRDSYTEAIASGDPFDSVDRFMHRFDAYTSRSNGFDLVVAYAGEGEPVGQTWGWPLGPDSGWWSSLQEEPEEGFTREDGRRTFALSEIMVRQDWTGKGIAHALHDELLRHRSETRATLLVEPDNTTAYRAYVSWGWRRVTQLRPGWPDAPTFDVLMLDLPLSSR